MGEGREMTKETDKKTRAETTTATFYGMEVDLLRHAKSAANNTATVTDKANKTGGTVRNREGGQ